MASAPRLILQDIALYERETLFRKPFRFGAVTVTGASQAFVRVEIATEDGRIASGATAELMVPKWFDKNPALSPGETVDELRRSLAIARRLYLGERRFLSAFGVHAACMAEQMARCGAEGIPPLAAAFGPAQIDKAVLDALLKLERLDVFSGLATNIAGIDARLTPDIGNDAIAAFLASRRPLECVAVRHTAGMLDPVDSLAEAAAHGVRYFKIKLGGDPYTDIARLAGIGAELARLGIDYRATVDANEQYADLEALAALCGTLETHPSLDGLKARLLYIEQPLPRELALETPLGRLGERFAFIIDESDDDYGAFPRARRMGYRGLSSKACKGVYKSLLNGARAMAWSGEPDGAPCFVAAEDLTCQVGLAVQQDTALVAFHGIAHAERNGHHYVDGFAGAPETEQDAFASAHPDLYQRDGGTLRLNIEDGAISTRTLHCPGFASAAEPHWPSLQPLAH